MQSVEREPEAQVGNAAAIFRRVLVPVDFSLVSQRAVHVALELRRLFGAKVCVLNLTHGGENDGFLGGIGSPTTPRQLAEQDRGALQRFVDNIAPGLADELEYEAHVGDDYVTGIRDMARAWKATLLLLSHESHRALLRTHTEKILRLLDVPVLVLPPAAGSPG